MFPESFSLQNPTVLTGLAVLAATLIAELLPVSCSNGMSNARLHCIVFLVCLRPAGGQVDGLDRHGLTPLMRALASSDDAAPVTELIKRGADPDRRNASGCTPLMMAADLDHISCIAELMLGGANDQAPDPSGRTALMRAVLAHHSDSVAQFVLGSMRLNIQDPQGKTALILAVQT